MEEEGGGQAPGRKGAGETARRPSVWVVAGGRGIWDVLEAGDGSEPVWPSDKARS